jgi:AAHS family 4-hydroxybenzoate transporter-like MFS transporter
LNPSLAITGATRFVASEGSKAGVPIVHLFRDGRTPTTLLLWLVNFMNIMMLYSLSNWLPTLVTGMGYDQRTAVLVGTVLQVGGSIGTFGLAYLIARRGFVPVLTLTFAIAASPSSASPASRSWRWVYWSSLPGGASWAASRD